MLPAAAARFFSCAPDLPCSPLCDCPAGRAAGQWQSGLHGRCSRRLAYAGTAACLDQISGCLADIREPGSGESGRSRYF